MFTVPGWNPSAVETPYHAHDIEQPVDSDENVFGGIGWQGQTVVVEYCVHDELLNEVWWSIDARDTVPVLKHAQDTGHYG